jgi:hypothetical protein
MGPNGNALFEKLNSTYCVWSTLIEETGMYRFCGSRDEEGTVSLVFRVIQEFRM